MSLRNTQYGAKAIFDDQESEANQIKYSDQDIDELLARSAEVNDATEKNGSAAAFAQAKIWELKRDDGHAAQASSEDENLHDFWTEILKEQELKDEAQKAAVSQNLGKRRRKDVSPPCLSTFLSIHSKTTFLKVVYNEKSAFDEVRNKASSKKRKNSSSDEEFKAEEEARSASDDSDEEFRVIDKSDLILDNHDKPVKPRGLAQPLANHQNHNLQPPTGPSNSHDLSSNVQAPIPGGQTAAEVAHARQAELIREADLARDAEMARMARKTQKKAEKARKQEMIALELLRQEKARVRRDNIETLARAAKQFHDDDLDAVLDKAINAPRDQQSESFTHTLSLST